jgi:glucose/arabinose dehydrogenase
MSATAFDPTWLSKRREEEKMRYGRVASSSLPTRRRQRPLHIEALENRLLLAGDTYLINFQFDEATPVTRYLVDSGQVFGDRGGGLSYGWSTDHTDQSRERSANPDQRLDTLVHFELGQRWEFALPNGTYEVTASIGDPSNTSTHTLNVEGVNYWNAVALAPNVFNSETMTVTVSDGELTLDQGTAIDKATRINYVHIVGVPSAPNNAPFAPTITEPATNGQVVHPADVHMEAIGFSDPDGNTHKSTDWEIWTVGPGAQPVWQTLGIQGVERLHTHMGDGIFINSRAGQTSLAANTDHELRVRFRDDAGAVSGYSVREFRTSSASVTFPLELRDVATTPAVTWRTVLGSNVDLPAGASILTPGDFIIAIDADGGSNSPVNETAPLAIDGVVGTKYLNFGFNPAFPQTQNSELNTGFIVTPSVGSTVVKTFQITTANDSVERDPTSWQLFGRNGPVSSTNHSTGTAETWTLIGSGSVALPGALPNGGGDDFRNTLGPVVNVTNNTAYTSYKMLFTDVKSAATANSMQIAEIQFFGDQAGTPPSLRLESNTGQLLLSLTGQQATGNLVNNPPGLADHVPVRVVIESGSKTVNLAPTNLTFNSETGDPVTIFLPAVDLNPNERLDLWVGFDGATYYGTAAQTEPDFSNLARMSEATTPTNPFVALQPGFVIEEVGNGYRLPVNIAFVPNPGPDADDPLYYVTELYGSIQVVTRDGTKHEFATGLLDYNPDGPISGTGEQGLTGITVQRDAANPEIYHLYVGMLWDNGQPPGGLVHYPKVERIDSAAGGLMMASRTVLLNMQPETQGQSHQISNVSIGPDGKLYVHNGDGFNTGTAQNLNQYRGKILRMNLDGSAPSDNPFYTNNGIREPRDYVFAYGVRNPFGGAWRASDGMHYEVENGPSWDRLAKIVAGRNYLWDGSDQSMTNFAIYNWIPANAPVNMTFVEPETFAGSQFPASKMDHLFVSESGPTYANGPQARGKRIVEFVLDDDGDLVSGPTTLVEYRGTGRGSVVGLAAGPDGLYFTEMYEDSGAQGPTAPGARIFRVRYVNPISGDYNIDGLVNQADYDVWRQNYGSNLLLAADGNRNGVVDTADFVIWRKAFGAAPPAAAQGAAAAPAESAPIREPVDDSASSSSPEEPHSHTPFTFTESSVTGSRPSFRPAARSPRAVDFSAIHDAALLTLLNRGSIATSPADSARPATTVFGDAVGDDSLESVDEVFKELALF